MIADRSPAISAVIRSLNEERHLPKLLHGLSRQSLQVSEIVVVDSGSSDSTVSIAERFGCKVVHIESTEFSFGRALNVGIEAAGGEILVLASAHVYPMYDTWIRNLVEPILKNTSVAVSYGRQVIAPEGRFSEGRLMERWFPGTSIDTQASPFHNNANAAIRREVWDAFKYDESLTGLEDLEFGKRVLGAGLSIDYVAEAPIVHVHEESTKQVVNRYRREAVAHRQIYPDQEMSAVGAARLAVANIAGDLLAAAKERRAIRAASGVLAFRTAQFFGSWRGFSQKGPLTEDLHRRFYYPAARSGRKPSDLPESIGNPIDYID